MSIRPEMRELYPKDWDEISHRIRFERAAGRCECEGECGIEHDGRCHRRHGDLEVRSLSGYGLAGTMKWKVVLTTGHLDHDPVNCVDENLRAWCQWCHLRYDRHEHARNAGRTRDRKSGQVRMFD